MVHRLPIRNGDKDVGMAYRLDWISRILKNERGNVLAMSAATMPLMIGAAAVGLDTIQLSLWKRQIQRMADSAALAGGRALVQSRDATAAARRDLLLNNQVPLLETAQVQHAPAVGAYAGDRTAVRLVLKVQRTLPFWQFFQNTSPLLTIEATAKIVKDGEFCMIALEDGTTAGIDITGSAVVNLGCGMATNSRATQAVTAQGSSSVLASPIAAVGGISHSSNFRAGTELHAYSAVQEDPLASLANPSIPAGACPPVLVEPNETETISPGCYSSMILKGNVTLQPGTYVIDAGSLQATSQSVISGSGVTIILTSRTADTNPSSIGTLTIDAGAKLNLTAPTSGPIRGSSSTRIGARRC
jgi:Flp pilus assembly protein TadG